MPKPLHLPVSRCLCGEYLICPTNVGAGKGNVVVKIPREHWDQIVTYLEKMSGLREEEIEVLSEAVVTE